MKEGKYRSVFGYFGGKSKTSHLYPSPYYNTIIEPFAGGAAYSARYWYKKVILCEKDPAVVAFWRFMTRPDCVDYVLSLNLPKTAKKGQHIHSLVPRDADPGLIRLAISCTNPNGDFRYRFTERGPVRWDLMIPRLKYYAPKVRHWEIHEGSYQTIPNQEATWFIDPPYIGQRLDNIYQTRNTIDYMHLAMWSKTRKGQVIVCEGSGASWLPFRNLPQGKHLIKQDGTLSAQELIWTKDPNVAPQRLDEGVEI